MNKNNIIMNQNKNAEEVEDEFDFIQAINVIWSGRKIIIICELLALVIGSFVAVLSPEVYSASTILVPQISNANKSQLSSLASLAGLDMGMAQNSEISPIIYPQIVNSIPFKIELMNTPIHFKSIKDPISIYDYYLKYHKPNILDVIKKYTIGLPGLIISAIVKAPTAGSIPDFVKEKKIFMLSDNQYYVKQLLDKAVKLQVEKKDGYLTLEVLMPEPLVAAEIAQKSQELMQKYITNFKVEKSQADLNFIQSRYDIAKREAELYQLNIAVSTDRYKNLTSNVPQVNVSRSQTKFAIANSIYMELAKQLEQAKIQVKKETPVFSIIEPVSVPNERTKPNRLMIIILWLSFGGFVSFALIFGKDILIKVRPKSGV